ncbi:MULTISPECIES: CBS domain-containing protein [unclassified Haladaptatus]|uniref:CBS domain-containing protein n=1 Tax=unclassified Haladaptatus TaxID=2622732 RepID=UPI0023E8396B|nr:MULTISPECIES: CBS domain-containing protein [unclassified Haladaptatus]
MKVSDAMTPRDSLVTVELPGTRDDVLEYLQERKFSSVPVIKQTDDGEEFRGLVSRESLIADPDEDQLALLVEEVPSTEADADITEVAELMIAEGARRVPVVDGQLEGIITVTDVVRAIAAGDAPGDMEVGELYEYRVNTVFSGAPLRVCERELSYADEAYGVVLDEEAEVAGIITEVDILNVARVVEGEDDTGSSIANEDDEWMWEGIKATGNRYLPTRNVELPSGPVSKFMSSDLKTIGRRRTAQDAAKMMRNEDIEQIPVMSGDELVGIVRDMDLLVACLQ